MLITTRRFILDTDCGITFRAPLVGTLHAQRKPQQRSQGLPLVELRCDLGTLFVGRWEIVRDPSPKTGRYSRRSKLATKEA